MPSHAYKTESRTTPFQEEEDDVDIPRVTQDQASDIQATVLQGPITHSHTKKLQQKVNSIIAEINFNISENVILPKCSTLVVLRYICERGGAALQGEETKKKNQMDQFGPRMNQ
jgi:CRISPR/Cas system-associated endoribonuclease Cas2